VRIAVGGAAAVLAFASPPPAAHADLDFWATTVIAAGDFDGDGHSDLAFVQAHLNGAPPHDGRVMLLLRDPDGHLDFRRARAAAVGDDPQAVVAADFDGDGRDDLATADWSGSSVSIVLTRPGAQLDVTLRLVGEHPLAVAAADADGDGLLDVVAAGDDGTYVVYADAPGVFGQAMRLGQSAEWLAAGDLDADGSADVVLVPKSRDATASFVVLLTDRAVRGAVRERIEIEGGKGRGPLAVADLDGDGDADVVRFPTVSGSGRGELWLSDGGAPPAFTLSQKVRVNGRPVFVAARDLDGDGDTDIAVTTDRSVTFVLRGDTAPFAFESRSKRRWNGYALNAAIADLDDDGRPDVAAAAEGITIVRQYHEKPGRLRPAVIARPHR
jgi:hypothetical protein